MPESTRSGSSETSPPSMPIRGGWPLILRMSSFAAEACGAARLCDELAGLPRRVAVVDEHGRAGHDVVEEQPALHDADRRRHVAATRPTAAFLTLQLLDDVADVVAAVGVAAHRDDHAVER